MASARILVADGDSGNRAAIVAVLQAGSYSPAPAQSLKEALQQADRSHDFDLVLLDGKLLSRDGADTVRKFRELLPGVPIVIAAAADEIALAAELLEKGAYDSISKPLQKTPFLTAVRRAVEYRLLTQQNAIYRQNLDQLVNARTEILHQAMADLERSYDITLEALGDALDLKDAETEGHSKRVTAFTIALARGMTLPMERIRVIARGAFLHDIGKMAIPDAILLKPGSLASDEEQIMREHCDRGYQILKKIPFLQEAAEIVYSHQEHFDGSGYPRGLKGEQIPLGARIFSIADALDAISSDRPYRKGKSFAAARGEIKRCAGTQFDPQIVEVYLRLPDQLWEDLRGQITHDVKRFSPFAFAANKLRNPFG